MRDVPPGGRILIEGARTLYGPSGERCPWCNELMVAVDRQGDCYLMCYNPMCASRVGGDPYYEVVNEDVG